MRGARPSVGRLGPFLLAWFVVAAPPHGLFVGAAGAPGPPGRPGRGCSEAGSDGGAGSPGQDVVVLAADGVWSVAVAGDGGAGGRGGDGADGCASDPARGQEPSPEGGDGGDGGPGAAGGRAFLRVDEGRFLLAGGDGGAGGSGGRGGQGIAGRGAQGEPVWASGGAGGDGAAGGRGGDAFVVAPGGASGGVVVGLGGDGGDAGPGGMSRGRAGRAGHGGRAGRFFAPVQERPLLVVDYGRNGSEGWTAAEGANGVTQALPGEDSGEVAWDARWWEDARTRTEPVRRGLRVIVRPQAVGRERPKPEELDVRAWFLPDGQEVPFAGVEGATDPRLDLLVPAGGPAREVLDLEQRFAEWHPVPDRGWWQWSWTDPIVRQRRFRTETSARPATLFPTPWTARPDVGGTLVFDLPSPGKLWIRVWHPRFGVAWTEAVSRERYAGDVSIRLDPRPTLSVLALDAAGRPLAHHPVRVAVWLDPASYDWCELDRSLGFARVGVGPVGEVSSVLWREVETDVEGRARLRVPRGQGYGLLVGDAGRFVFRTVAASATEPRDVELTADLSVVAAAPPVELRFHDAEGAPLAGAVVRLAVANDAPWVRQFPPLTTDDSGTVRVAGFAAGERLAAVVEHPSLTCPFTKAPGVSWTETVTWTGEPLDLPLLRPEGDS